MFILNWKYGIKYVYVNCVSYKVVIYNTVPIYSIKYVD